MATYQFSALSDGQAISFNPTADVLNFDQSAIAAADIRVTATGTSTRIDVIAGPTAGKDITLLNTTPFQLAMSNVNFVDGSRLLFGDNSTATGDDNGNTLNGGTGRDLIFAFGGSDTINVGTANYGADHIDGGASFDTLNFSGYVSAALTIDFAAGTISSSGGNATFANIERVIAGTGNDSIAGGAGAQNLTSGAGNDTLWGAGGVDTLWSGIGADVLIFREIGTANADNVGDFTSGTDKITLDASVMTALGASGNFAPGDARFWAAAGATGGHDADDRVVYNTTTRQVFYDADGSGSGAAQLIATLQSGANLVATDIAVQGGGSSGGGQTINGTSGNDSLVGTSGNDTINGLAGNDTLVGNAGDDSLDGGTGNDSIDGGTGNDILVVDSRDDVLSDAGGVDTVIAHGVNWGLGDSFENLTLTGNGTAGSFGLGSGNDFNNRIDASALTIPVQLDGHGGNDTVIGGSANDELSGWGGNDWIIAGDGDDLLDPFARHDGNDTLDGGLGNDRYQANPGDVLVDAGGIDTVLVTTSWTLGTGFENLRSSNPTSDDHDAPPGIVGIGNELNNVIDFSGFNGVRIDGRAGNDSIIGSGANDTLSGGAGNDTLVGGVGVFAFGSDIFSFAEAPGSANADQILEFDSGESKIRLDGSVMTNLGTSGNFSSGDARFYSAAGATGGHDADDRVIFNTTTRQLFYDADGSGAGSAQLIATVPDSFVQASDIEVANGAGGVHTTGTSGNDSLNGTAADDTMDGLAGNDTINGFGGSDSLIGGAGNDSIWGGVPEGSGDGSDTLIGGDGNDTLIGTTDWHFNEAADSLDGGLGNDVFYVDNPFDTVSDAGGIDLVVAVDMDWTLGEGFENLTIHSDRTEGGYTAIGNELDNVITSGFGGSRIEGRGGNDTLFGGERGHTFGGEGNDLLVGGAVANGGAGADVFALNFTDSIADFASGIDKIRLDGNVFPFGDVGASGNFAPGDERFHAAPGATTAHDATDRLIYNTATGELYYDRDGTGSADPVWVARLQGQPTLVATDIEVVNGTGGEPVNGTAGNDSMVGTSSNDTLNGLGGNDTLRGLDGNDVLDGGAGVDSLDGGLGDDTYIVTAGDVIVSDPGGSDTVFTPVSVNISSNNVDNVTATGTSNVSVEGNNLSNVIVGNDAPNYINARGGSDTITGNGGNDTFNMSMGGTFRFGSDSIDGGSGVDTVEYGINAKSGLVADLFAGNVTGGQEDAFGFATILNIERFIAGDFNDVVTGSGVANYVDARAGNDTVNGIAGNDTIIGGTGNDRLAGGTGVDSMTGGAGLDSFVFAEAGPANADRITDFVSASDKIALDDAGFTNIGAPGNFAVGDGRFWAAAGATSGHDANDRVIYNTSTGSLYYDADGSGAGAAQLIATFTGNPAIAATDITVI